MHFWKYHGAGNDFILVDQRERIWIQPDDHQRIALLCDRHFGIGADGLILLSSHLKYDFEMVYFNADGRKGSLCGNGGRCVVAFAYRRGIQKKRYQFWATDGLHEAELTSLPSPWEFQVALHLSDVAPFAIRKEGLETDPVFVLNTGSPHYVRWVEGLDAIDMIQEGRAVRYSEAFRTEGVNVNFVEACSEGLRIRTYERGVENETLACGTGATAAALAWHAWQDLPAGDYELPIHARGGSLTVRFTALPSGEYTNIWLCGPAVEVFEGETFL
ncbi:MAG: diaminopimelate epimerase [Saprospiraceae bacterium]|nr:diaminopimelate epimerase [Saprospiraceae bacterium]MDW8485275.1 diaminopimelate epimerase [Saprospiraceae bacterium]